ncbi:MAG: alpha-L-fucosidase [Mangrovibacterium sp.]
MKNLVLVLFVLFMAHVNLFGQEKELPAPNLLLHPPKDITPAKTMYSGGWESAPIIPPVQRSEKERRKLEKDLDWFYQAKYGLFFHFLAPQGCTEKEWDNMVNSVDVEKFADKVKKTGAGYVALSIGQNHLYSCAPNRVLERLWELTPGEYTSERDLPMDLYQALKKRGIKLMLYVSTDNQYKLPVPESFTQETDRFENWVKVLEWYSKHYGKRCLGWWVDGLNEDYKIDYRRRVHEALKTGNPDAIVGSSSYGISGYTHGHCDEDWNYQQQYRKPYYGRWHPGYEIQWHVFQYLGSSWGKSDTAHFTESIVNYATDVIKGGGVFTFDIGQEEMLNGIYLDIPEGQMQQLMAVKKALMKIDRKD